MPTNPISCRQCGAPRACRKDQLCHSCRITAISRSRKRHDWTAELDERLRRTYRSSSTRAVLVDGITHLQRLTGFPRAVIVSRAAQLGLATKRGKRWDAQQISILQESAGARPATLIARELQRSYYSVKGQLSRLQISARVMEGYSQQDLECLLGVSSKRVRRWIQLKWIRPRRGRVEEEEIARFVRRHPEEYQLNRVDEAWFKGLLFPAFNSARVGDLQSRYI